MNFGNVLEAHRSARRIIRCMTTFKAVALFPARLTCRGVDFSCASRANPLARKTKWIAFRYPTESGKPTDIVKNSNESLKAVRYREEFQKISSGLQAAVGRQRASGRQSEANRIAS
jgi:hypothetical protein